MVNQCLRWFRTMIKRSTIRATLKEIVQKVHRFMFPQPFVLTAQQRHARRICIPWQCINKKVTQNEMEWNASKTTMKQRCRCSIQTDSHSCRISVKWVLETTSSHGHANSFEKWQRKKHPNRFAFMTANSHICHLKCGTWLKRHFDIIKVWPGMKGKTHKLPPRFLKYHMEISVLALILDSQPARNLESPIHRRNKEKHRKRERKWKTKENKISENRKTPHRHKLSEKRKRMH